MKFREAEHYGELGWTWGQSPANLQKRFGDRGPCGLEIEVSQADTEAIQPKSPSTLLPEATTPGDQNHLIYRQSRPSTHLTSLLLLVYLPAQGATLWTD